MKALKEDLKEKFWTVNLGHVIVLLGYVVSGAYYVGQFRAENATLKLAQEEFKKNLLQVEQKIATFDLEGTSKSRSNQESNSREFTAHDKRIQRLEDMIPQISEMKQQISNLSADFAFIKSYILDKRKNE